MRRINPTGTCLPYVFVLQVRPQAGAQVRVPELLTLAIKAN